MRQTSLLDFSKGRGTSISGLAPQTAIGRGRASISSFYVDNVPGSSSASAVPGNFGRGLPPQTSLTPLISSQLHVVKEPQSEDDESSTAAVASTSASACETPPKKPKNVHPKVRAYS